MSIAGISFDAAGTLIHFARPVGELYAEAGLQYGLRIDSITAERRLAVALKSAPAPVPEAGKDADAFEYRWWKAVAAEVYGCRDDDVRLQACFAELFHYYAKADAWRIHDELPWLLQQLLASNYRLAVCSNFDGRLLAIIDDMGLMPYFETIMIPRLSGFVKPQSGMFVAVAQSLGVAPQQILHVGDHAGTDVAAAARMGFTALQWSLPPEADVKEAYEHLRNATGGVE